jgi:Sigma-70 region 2
MEDKPKKKRHYVNNKTLYEEMVKFKEAVKVAEANNKPLPRVPRYVGECFLMICNKLSSKPNFAGYSYRDDMIADAIENCVASAHSFDPTKSTNPFAYFTQIAWNAFIRRIAKEKKQSYIKHKNFIHSNLMDGLNEESSMTGQPIHNEYSDDIIRNFEEKMVRVAVKAKKASKAGVEKFIEDDSENSANN